MFLSSCAFFAFLNFDQYAYWFVLLLQHLDARHFSILILLDLLRLFESF